MRSNVWPEYSSKWATAPNHAAETKGAVAPTESPVEPRKKSVTAPIHVPSEEGPWTWVGGSCEVTCWTAPGTRCRGAATRTRAEGGDSKSLLGGVAAAGVALPSLGGVQSARLWIDGGTGLGVMGGKGMPGWSRQTQNIGREASPAIEGQ